MTLAVFISYRRSDTVSGYAASWIYSELAASLGTTNVFIDVDSIPPGADFVDFINGSLASCEAALVLIGPGWLNAVGRDGVRRLDNPTDYVRVEVATALGRDDVRVIPVAVGGAAMPDPHDLPPDLQPLTRLQALSFQRRPGEMRRLVTTIRSLTRNRQASQGGSHQGAAPPVDPSPPAPRRAKLEHADPRPLRLSSPPSEPPQQPNGVDSAAERRAAESDPGLELIPNYTLERLLGLAGVGSVYVAFDRFYRRRVEITVIDGASPRFRRRFDRHMLLASSIRHPHLIPIYETGEHDGLLFLITYYVDGPSLRDVILAEGALEPTRAWHIISQAASALDAAHARRLVHGDVRPVNLRLCPAGGDECVYVTGLGVSQAQWDTQEDNGSRRVGRIAYLSPEFLAGSRLDARSDVCSLALTTYHALAGTLPSSFLRAHPQSAEFQVLAPANGHLVPPLPEHLPYGVGLVLAQGWATDPDERFESAGSFAEALGEALATAG